jgi:prefoldin subunit 5
MLNLIDEYNALRRKFNSLSSEAEKLKGKLAYVNEQLSELGFESIEDAKDFLKTASEKCNKSEQKLQKKLTEADQLLQNLE